MTMIKSLLIAGACAVAYIPAFSALPTRAFSYAEEGSRMVSMPVYMNDVYSVGIRIDNPQLAGRKALGARVQVYSDQQDLTDCSVWISAELDVVKDDAGRHFTPDIYSVAATPDKDGFMDIMFPEAVTIPESGLYVGYTFTLASYDKERKSPLCYSQSRHDGGFYYFSQLGTIKWADYEDRMNGVLPVTVWLEDDFADEEAGIAGWDTSYPYAQIGEEFTLPVLISNIGHNPLTSIGYTYESGLVAGTGTLSLPVPVTPSLISTTAVDFDFLPIDRIGKENLTLSLTSLNGRPLDRPVSVKLPLECRSLVPVTHVVLEEATGAWCSACPRGAAAIERLGQIYGDRFIGLAYHRKDAMHTAAETPFEIPHFPSAVMNRGELIDPYYGSQKAQTGYFPIRPEVDAALRKFAEADVQVSSEWEGADAIKATAEISFVSGRPTEGYSVEFILMENGLKGKGNGWVQSNSNAGGDPEAVGDVLAPLTQLGHIIPDYVFDHVVLIRSLADEKLPAEMQEAKYETVSVTLDLADAVCVHDENSLLGLNLIQNRDALEVVALLIGPDGSVVNAAKAKVGENSLVEEIGDTEVVATEWYDLTGNRVAYDAPGVKIRVDRMADGSRRVCKLIVR